MDDEGNPQKIEGPSLESRWERALIIISIPHGAAFGAFYGKYDFFSQGGSSQFLCVSVMMALLPLTTAWLFLVHDLLRNVFLRVGHFGLWFKIKHSFLYYCTGLAPLMLLFLMSFEVSKENKISVMGLLWVLFSWAFCATLLSNAMYLNAAKALGIKVDD